MYISFNGVEQATLGILGCWSFKFPKTEVQREGFLSPVWDHACCHKKFLARPASQTSQRSGILLLGLKHPKQGTKFLILSDLGLKKAMHSTQLGFKKLHFQVLLHARCGRIHIIPVALSLHCLGCYFGRCSGL